MIRRGERVTVTDLTELFRGIIKKINSLTSANFSLMSTGQFYWHSAKSDVTAENINGYHYRGQMFNTTSEQYLDSCDQPDFGQYTAVSSKNDDKLLTYYEKAIELLENK